MLKGKSHPFFQGANFEVKEPKINIGRKPRTVINDESLFIAIKLAKIGYYSGNPELILEAPVNMVLAILNYEMFDIDLENAYNDIIKEGNL